MKDRSAFAQSQTEKKNTKESRNYHLGHKRFCIECALRDKVYVVGTFITTVVSETVIRDEEYSYRGFRSCQDTINLVVSPTCKQACEYTVVSAPAVCKACEEAHIEHEEARIEQDSVKDNNCIKHTGKISILCGGCKVVTELMAARKPIECPGCDTIICGRCTRDLSENNIGRCRCKANGRLITGMELTQQYMWG